MIKCDKSWMKQLSPMFMALLCIIITVTLYPNSKALAADGQRVVILAPSAADIVDKLGFGKAVVGVTNSVEEFPNAERVGTHINPCIECVVALNPTIIIATGRFAKTIPNARYYIYEPNSVDGILDNITHIAAMLDVSERGADLVAELKKTLANVVKLPQEYTMFYEMRSNPVSVAGRQTVISDALMKAGMRNMATTDGSFILSTEYLLMNQPNYYIYQQGPMNKNPVPPKERAGWGKLKSCVMLVDEKKFARANTQIFDEIVNINRMLQSGKCD